MTAALEGGEWSAARPGRTLPPGKTRYLFYSRLGGPQGRSGRAENLVPTDYISVQWYCIRTHVTLWLIMEIYIISLYWYIVVYWRNIIQYTNLLLHNGMTSVKKISWRECTCFLQHIFSEYMAWWWWWWWWRRSVLKVWVSCVLQWLKIILW